MVLHEKIFTDALFSDKSMLITASRQAGSTTLIKQIEKNFKELNRDASIKVINSRDCYLGRGNIYDLIIIDTNIDFENIEFIPKTNESIYNRFYDVLLSCKKLIWFSNPKTQDSLFYEKCMSPLFNKYQMSYTQNTFLHNFIIDRIQEFKNHMTQLDFNLQFGDCNIEI